MHSPTLPTEATIEAQRTTLDTPRGTQSGGEWHRRDAGRVESRGRSEWLREAGRGRRDRPHGWRRAWHTVRAATAHDSGTGWAQIHIDVEDAPTAHTEARTAPQTVQGCRHPTTARNAPHRARRSPTQGTAWHGGTASAHRPDPAPQMPHSTHSTAEPQSRKPLKTQGFHSPTKKSCSNLIKSC